MLTSALTGTHRQPLGLNLRGLFRTATSAQCASKASKKKKKDESDAVEPAPAPSLWISIPLALSGTTAGMLAAYLGGADARASKLSPIGGFVLATLGGAGGGTLRACLSGQPAAWISAPGYLYACLAMGGAGYLGLGERVRQSRLGKLFMQTVFKLSVPGCAIVGGEIAQSTNAYTGMLFGLITATGGGFVRDVILSRAPPAALAYGPTFVDAAPVVLGTLVHSSTARIFRKSPNARYLTTIAAALGLNNYLAKRFK